MLRLPLSRFRLISATLALSGFCFGQTSVPNSVARDSAYVPAGFQLVWNDEFDGPKLDAKKWQLRYPGKREAGFISPDAVSLDAQGHLLLTTQEKEGQLLNGHVGTDRTFTCTFGYFEARLKFAKLRGQHGCFWLQSNAPRLPGDPHGSGVEVDIAEYFGPGRKDSGLGVNVYWLNGAGKAQREGGIVKLPSEVISKQKALNEDFHVFGLEWSAEEYVFFVDGHEVFRTREGVSHKPAYLVLSLLTANWEVAYLDRSNLPDSMLVDYIRVYQARPKGE